MTISQRKYLPFCFAAKQVSTRMSEGVNNSRAGLIGLILIYFLNICIVRTKDRLKDAMIHAFKYL